MNVITSHMEEYLDTVTAIKRKLCKTNKPVSHPIEFVNFLKESLMIDDWPSFDKKLGKSNRARSSHNYYGWMSYTEKPLGKCKGAIYRSEEYMKIPLQERSGESLKNLKKRGNTYAPPRSYRSHDSGHFAA